MSDHYRKLIKGLNNTHVFPKGFVHKRYQVFGPLSWYAKLIFLFHCFKDSMFVGFQGVPSQFLSEYEFGMKVYTSQPITAHLFLQEELQ